VRVLNGRIPRAETDATPQPLNAHCPAAGFKAAASVHPEPTQKRQPEKLQGYLAHQKPPLPKNLLAAGFKAAAHYTCEFSTDTTASPIVGTQSLQVLATLSALYGLFNEKLSGDEVNYTNSSILFVKNMRCSKIHCQEAFNLKGFSHKAVYILLYFCLFPYFCRSFLLRPHEVDTPTMVDSLGMLPVNIQTSSVISPVKKMRI
jgi:hypothetical protein